MEARLHSIIERTLEKKPKTSKFQYLPDSKSFWSRCYRASFTWDSDVDIDAVDEFGRQKHPRGLFIKLPIISENALRATNPEDSNALAIDLVTTLKVLMEKELQFYKEFGNENMGKFLFPKFYGGEPITDPNTGYLVFQDVNELYGKIFSMDYVPGFTIEQALILVKAIAHFHHFCLTKKDKSWVKNFEMDLEEQKQFQEGQFDSASIFENVEPSLKGKMEQIRHLFAWEYGNEIRNGEYPTGIPKVLVHQDLNPTNVLWRTKMEQTMLAAVIDFQLIVTGSPCEDIIRILSLGLSRSDRDKNTLRVLQVYYDELTSLFGGKPIFSFSQLCAEYERVFAFSNNFSLFGLSCYYGQYKDGDLDSEKRNLILAELADRAKGIIEDILEYTGNKENTSK